MRYLGLAAFTVLFVAILVTNSQADAQPTNTVRDTTQQMLDAHHCWTGAAPADMRGKYPAHAVVDLNDEGPQYVASRVGFDIWLHGHPGILYGFCR